MGDKETQERIATALENIVELLKELVAQRNPAGIQLKP